ncbi:DUF411 domain-containing protein [Marinobacterium rhizophilum]|uniref:DUF411 domain-containing protein n=1 Tax=Marinobacterium rhizophilum TaxID=420402 RepID=A0ABY5HEF1_9GAMM|nr:DUF411 domain-containing protein [Marinobacterium rhizophilum]UTW10738.1 DUF411 domain-containing protein [Marinobacterium rhizophilum]
MNFFNPVKLLSPLLLVMGLLLPGAATAGEPVKGTMYKNPQCGCCQGHADYLAEQGFEIDVIPTDDLTLFKQQHGVPRQLEGCHTLLIDGYVIEGHVPANSIRRLLQERPQIRGIAVPGMPAGSPGMGGQKTAPLAIYELADGMPRVFAVE